MHYIAYKNTNKYIKWIRWICCLVLVATFLVTPVTTTAATTIPGAVNTGHASYLPSLHNNACYSTRTASNPFGVQVYGNGIYNQPYFNYFLNTQGSWLRNSISWAQIEPNNVTPSQFNWSQADRVIKAASDLCLNLLITVDEVPAWAATEGHRSPIKPELLPKFAEFMSNLVERYDGDGFLDAPSGAVVNYWEIFNEPDMGEEVPGEFGWGLKGDQYANMLKAIYAPIHNVNLNAKVVFGGIAYDLLVEDNGLFVRSFFQDVLDADGGPYFDVMNFHYYPFQYNRNHWTQTSSSGLVEKFADIRSRLTAKGLEKPLMVTELGWHSNAQEAYPSSTEFQGRQVIQLATQSIAIGAMVLIWWQYSDATQMDASFPFHTGLLSSSSLIAAKPSFTVFSEAAKRLGTSKFEAVVTSVSATNDLEAYKFRQADGKIFYVAWENPVSPYDAFSASVFNDVKNQSFQVPGTKAIIYSKEGALNQTILDGDDGANDGKVTVVVGTNPVYIVID